MNKFIHGFREGSVNSSAISTPKLGVLIHLLQIPLHVRFEDYSSSLVSRAESYNLIKPILATNFAENFMWVSVIKIYYESYSEIN